MGISGNEVSAANQQRHNEELTQSPAGDVLGSTATVAGTTVTLANSLAAGGHAGLAIAGSVVAGMGIVDWFRKLGTSKVNENLEALGQATEDALNRVENILKEQGTDIDEIRRRLDSEEFRNAMASASLQALRTTQQERLKRLASILANGVKDNDLSAENNDDMMRAAIELKDRDIELLGKIYKSQMGLLGAYQALSSEWSQQVTMSWPNDFSFLDAPGNRDARSSLARLQSAGLVQEVSTMMARTGTAANQPYGLLPDGSKFYERLQEIGTAV